MILFQCAGQRLGESLPILFRPTTGAHGLPVQGVADMHIAAFGIRLEQGHQTGDALRTQSAQAVERSGHFLEVRVGLPLQILGVTELRGELSNFFVWHDENLLEVTGATARAWAG